VGKSYRRIYAWVFTIVRMLVIFEFMFA